MNAARPPSTALHQLFEWNDERAAENYREEQAKGIIRSVRILRSDVPNATPRVVRAFVESTGSDGRSNFQPAARVATDADEGERARAAFLAELDSLEEKYGMFHDLARLCADLKARAAEALRQQSESIPALRVVTPAAPPSPQPPAPTDYIAPSRQSMIDRLMAGPFATGQYSHSYVSLGRFLKKELGREVAFEEIRDALGILVRQGTVRPVSVSGERMYCRAQAAQVAK